MIKVMARVLMAAALLAAAASSVSADQGFAIKNRDRVVFYGDSITDNAQYPRTIEQYVRGRYPKLNVDFHNLGWGGDSTPTLKRMERDLLPLAPTLVFIMLGMNDGGYAPYSDATADRYIAGMDKLVGLVRERAKARVILITTVPYETGVSTSDKGKELDTFYPETLRKMSDKLIAWAQAKRVPVIDLNKMYGEAIAACKKADPVVKFSGDGVHPNASGQAIMAFCILKALGADGDFLRLVIDGRPGDVLASENQTISHFASKATSFSFTRKVTVFPFFAGGGTLSFDLGPWYDQLNRDMLTIRNLTAPYYILTVNGGDTPLGVFTRDELEQGVDLSLRGGGLPEFTTATFIADAVAEKSALRYKHWRSMLLNGVRSAWDFAPYQPETSEGLLLAAKADAIAAFLRSDGLFCPAHTLKFSASESAVVSPDSLFSVILPLYSDKRDIVTGTSANYGALAESVKDGGKTYTFTYTYKGTWWAGCTLSLGDAGGQFDASGFDAIQLAYKGMQDGQRLVVGMASPGTGDEGKGELLEVGGPVGTYTTVTFPLARFRKGQFDLSKVAYVQFGVTGAESGEGAVSVRSVRFVSWK